MVVVNGIKMPKNTHHHHHQKSAQDDIMSPGFGFQQDIVSTASITHLITGKALKALSDGGVSFYSVAAVSSSGNSFLSALRSRAPSMPTSPPAGASSPSFPRH